jgi:hypothetical protein
MTNPLDAAAPTGRAKTRKMLIGMGVGAIVGASVTYALLAAVEKSGFDMDDPARLAALAAGIVFALMGAMVGLGTLVPQTGAHLLNVEDADELREQRRPLSRGSMIMLLIGGAMIALALAEVGGAAGMLTREAATIVVVVASVGVAGLSIAGKGENDELIKAVGTEAAAGAMYAVLTIFGLWAALAHLGYLAWIEPLGLLAALLAVQLGAAFWVSARRGLLRPR